MGCNGDICPLREANFLHGAVTSGKYSDLKFVCRGETFQVHKLVVCAQSPVLARMVDGKFKVRLQLPCSRPDNYALSRY